MGERSCNNISHFFQFSGMNLIGAQRFMHIQLKKPQTSSESAGEFTVPLVMAFLERQTSVDPQPMTCVQDRSEEGIKCLCSVYIPICEVTDPIKYGPVISDSHFCTFSSVSYILNILHSLIIMLEDKDFSIF